MNTPPFTASPKRHKPYSGLILAAMMTLTRCAVAVSAALGMID